MIETPELLAEPDHRPRVDPEVRRLVGEAMLDSPEALRSITEALPAIPKLLEYVWRRNMQAAARNRLLRGDPDVSPPMAIGFADLVGFTSLSQQISATDLSEVVDRFERIANDTVASLGGRVIKMIGDEVMFSVGDPRQAIEVGLELAATYREDDELSDVRVGAELGCGAPTRGRLLRSRGQHGVEDRQRLVPRQRRGLRRAARARRRRSRTGLALVAPQEPQGHRPGGALERGAGRRRPARPRGARPSARRAQPTGRAGGGADHQHRCPLQGGARGTRAKRCDRPSGTRSHRARRARRDIEERAREALKRVDDQARRAKREVEEQAKAAKRDLDEQTRREIEEQQLAADEEAAGTGDE